MKYGINNFNRTFLVGFLILLFVVPLAFAQSGESGTIEAEDVVTSRFLGVADSSIVKLADNYVKLKLGEDYYGRYISLDSGSSYEECTRNSCKIRNEVYFNHDIPFDIIEDPHLGGIMDIIITLDEDGDIVRYLGPVEAHEFLITKESAINLAKDYGIVNIVDAGIAASYGGEGYEIVWAVSSNDIVEYGEVLNEPLYRGVYIGVDTGKVLGEYRINPMIATPLASGKGAILGEFFSSNEGLLEENGFQKTVNLVVIILIALVSLIVIFFIWYRVYKK